MPTFQKAIEEGQILLGAFIGEDSLEKSYQALLDTGAQRTMISPKVVQENDLQGIGYTDIVPASGEPIQVPRYRIPLSIPIKKGIAIFWVGQELEVGQLPFQPDNFDILLGMDFLRRFHFTMYGDSFILSN